MQFRPDKLTTVESRIQLYCNASTVGLKNVKNERWELTIHDQIKRLNTCDSITETIECTVDIHNVTHADAKRYFCVAKLQQGCSKNNSTLVVKGNFLSHSILRSTHLL